MKIFFIIWVAIVISGCTNSVQQHKTKDTLLISDKSNQSHLLSYHNDSIKYEKRLNEIRQSSIEKGIYSYIRKDTLYVFLKKELISKLNVPLSFDTIYEINQYQVKANLFVGLSYIGDAVGSFVSVLDIKSNRWLVNHPLESKDYGVSDYLGSSEDNKYHLFEGGTAAGERGIEVMDSNDNIVMAGGYYPDADKNQLQWISGNKFYYFHDCAKDSSPPQNLPKLKEGYFYAQKHYFVNGKDSLSNEYKSVFFE